MTEHQGSRARADGKRPKHLHQVLASNEGSGKVRGPEGAGSRSRKGRGPQAGPRLFQAHQGQPDNRGPTQASTSSSPGTSTFEVRQSPRDPRPAGPEVTALTGNPKGRPGARGGPPQDRPGQAERQGGEGPTDDYANDLRDQAELHASRTGFGKRSPGLPGQQAAVGAETGGNSNQRTASRRTIESAPAPTSRRGAGPGAQGQDPAARSIRPRSTDPGAYRRTARSRTSRRSRGAPPPSDTRKRRSGSRGGGMAYTEEQARTLQGPLHRGGSPRCTCRGLPPTTARPSTPAFRSGGKSAARQTTKPLYFFGQPLYFFTRVQTTNPRPAPAIQDWKGAAHHELQEAFRRIHGHPIPRGAKPQEVGARTRQSRCDSLKSIAFGLQGTPAGHDHAGRLRCAFAVTTGAPAGSPDYRTARRFISATTGGAGQRGRLPRSTEPCRTAGKGRSKVPSTTQEESQRIIFRNKGII